MAKRNNKLLSCCVGLILILISAFLIVQVWPILALIVIALAYIVLKKNKPKLKPELPPEPDMLTPAQISRINSYAGELRIIQKKFNRPAQWKTQVIRIQEALIMREKLVKAAPAKGVASDSYKQFIRDIDSTNKTVSKQIAPAINRHFLDQLDKAREINSTVRTAKICESNISQLDGMLSFPMEISTLAQTLILQFNSLLNVATDETAYKQNLSEAISAERSGNKDDALTKYLDMLYTLKTDLIDDSQQAEQIGDLENRVRVLVKSYAPLRRRRRRS